MTHIKLKNQRPKAFWGALIASVLPSVINVAGGIAAANKQAKAMKEQQEAQARLVKQQQQLANDSNMATSLNNYANTVNNNIESDDEYLLKYKAGGSRKLRNITPIISDGGYAIPIDKNTYLLRGALHEEINESGKTGIGIKIGNKEIEAQDGEVVQKYGDSLRIYSDEPILNGISPAKKVLVGENKTKTFNDQQAVTKRLHLSNNNSNINRKQAKWGATFTTPDYIGLGTNIGANILGGILSSTAYNDILNNIKYEIPEYSEESYVNSPVTWNNEAQKAAAIRNDINTKRIIAKNTASGNVARSAMQDISTNTMYDLIKLADEKTNKETEMRQANAAREQEVRARNAQRRNEWSKSVAEIRNQENLLRTQIAQNKLNSNLGMIQGISDSIGGFLQSGIDNYQNDQNRLMYLSTFSPSIAKKLINTPGLFSKRVIRAFNNQNNVPQKTNSLTYTLSNNNSILKVPQLTNSIIYNPYTKSYINK